MPLRTAPLEEPSLNLTSMLDVVMLLILFFIFGTQFKDDERQNQIQLPTAADASALVAQPDEVVLNVTREGQFVLHGQTVTIEQAEVTLREAIANFPNQGVVVRGDGTGVYQHVVDALSACRRAGVRNISLAHESVEEPR